MKKTLTTTIMKKTVTFITLLFLCLSAVAQGTLLPSAKVRYDDRKYTYIYDERGNVLEEHTFDIKDGKWVESSYLINTYYADNSLESFATYYYSSGNLVFNQKYSYKYDSKGRKIEEIQYRAEGKSFVYSAKYESVYNEDDNLTSYIRYTYSSSSKEWKKEFTDLYWYTEGKLTKSVDERYITEYSYDTKGRLIEEIQQYRTGSNYNYKKTYSYYNTDSLQTAINYSYQSASFVESTKTEYTYDIPGRTTTFKTYYKSGGDWVGCYGSIKTWNAQGQITYEANMEDKDFHIAGSTNYEYNTKGQLVSAVSPNHSKDEYEYDSFGNMVTFIYSEYSNGDYVPNSKNVYVIDSNNNVDSYTRYNWNAEANTWEANTAQSQDSYYYLYDGYRLNDDPRFAVTINGVTTEYKGVSAFAAAQKAPKANVKLLADTNDDNIGVRLTQGDITFDLNGHTFQHHIYVNKATLTIDDSSADKTGLVQTTLNEGNNDNNESLVLAEGTLNIKQAIVKGEYPICVYGGSLNVYGGDFTDESAEDAIYIEDGVATLYGGKFKSLNIIYGGTINIATGYVYKTAIASTDLRGEVDNSFQTGYYGEVVEDNQTPTAISGTSAGYKRTVKTIENGQVVIIRDGNKYDVMGRKL